MSVDESTILENRSSRCGAELELWSMVDGHATMAHKTTASEIFIGIVERTNEYTISNSMYCVTTKETK
jgi:hypothetical protein